MALSAVYSAPTRRVQAPRVQQLRPLVPLRAMQPARPVDTTSRQSSVRVTCQAATGKNLATAVSPISDTSAWTDLQKHQKAQMPHLRQLMSDEKRCSSMFVSFDGITLDYSRQVWLQQAPMRSSGSHC